MIVAFACFLGASLSALAPQVSSERVPVKRPAVDPLEAGFLRPPNSAKPLTWWHWIDGNISKEGIAADLAAMHRVGIQGAQILDVGMDYPDGPVPYMSPQWFDLVRFAAEEANRLGMDLGVHNSAGWSSRGGPWVTPEHAMQTVVTSETRVTGGEELRLQLERPPTKFDFYREIAVLAFRTPENGARIENLAEKTLSGAEYRTGLLPDRTPVPPHAAIPLDGIVDLTAKTAPDGRLVWNAPAGEWTILRIGHTPRGEENRPATKAGRGLEIDKLSRAALDLHWKKGVEPILARMEPSLGKARMNVLLDSYEVGANNWTPGFREEFRRRRGYDPIPYLPALSGRYVGSAEITERFLWDLRRTIGDLFAENYYGHFIDLCRARGVDSYIEPYDGPFESLEIAARATVPMGEFWVAGPDYAHSIRIAASIAHVQGKPVVGAESFTATGNDSKWLGHPGGLKRVGDWAWTMGINRYVFHSYAHQPWKDLAPGMAFNQFGTEFGRMNTWWEPSRAWMSYIARSQFLLQQGRGVADVLFFMGETSPNGAVNRPDLKARGYDYDSIGSGAFAALTVQDGQIRTPGGARYRVLVLPQSGWMTPEVVARIGALARAGATIVGERPSRSPSLRGYPAVDAEVAKRAGEIWGSAPGTHPLGRGRVISGRTVESVLDDLKLPPDFATANPEASLNFIHRTVVGTDLYFIANGKGTRQTVDCAFRITGKLPELWDPASGRIVTPAVWRREGDRTIVPLTLDGTGSLFVVFRKPTRPDADPIVRSEFKPDDSAPRPLPDLRIIGARYGTFPPDEILDVTDRLATRIADGRLATAVGNDLAGDPAFNTPKELRIQYTVGGETKVATFAENVPFSLPLPGETGAFRLVKALYGAFDPALPGMPPETRSLDVTATIAARVAAGETGLLVGDELVTTALPPTTLPSGPRELRLEYTVQGDPFRANVPNGRRLDLAEEEPLPTLTADGDRTTLTSPTSGSLSYVTASGRNGTATVPAMPAPMELTGSWQVEFPAGKGAPPRASLERLLSWPQSPIEGIRYFSGTATYRKSFSIPATSIRPGRTLELDLGRVGVIAEVALNGKPLGILWKAPFRVELGDAARAGENRLEIRVTNLWPNRIIGDARFSEDLEWSEKGPPSRWPDWLVKNEPRPATGRIAFATWRHWTADSPLLPSGLIGPVRLRAYDRVVLEP